MIKKIFLVIVLLINTVYGQDLKGRVLDYNSKSPISGISIKINNENQIYFSDSLGYFNINNVINYPFKLSLFGNGFNQVEYNIKSHTDELVVISLEKNLTLNEVIVSGRRRFEVVQEIPIPMTVISGRKSEDAGAFNVNRLKELVPSVQMYSSNARNTTLNIRGLGSTFGLTNDGIESGVGFYIDGVYHARPAITSLDFVDIDQIEILKGPQGTLFGKNTTSGAFNITTKKPTETPEANVEISYGNYNYIQTKTSFSGKVTKNISTRFSFSGTQRTGTIYNERDKQNYNGLNNLGFKGQLYYNPKNNLTIHLIGDYNNQKPDGSSLVIAGITKTQRSSYRQYENIVKDLGYSLPTINPFSRVINTNTPYKHNQDLGGLSLNVDYKIGKGTLTSTSAWRFWNWDPVNDRDFSELSALTKSQAPSHHDQISQEIRYSGSIFDRLSGTLGVYYLNQKLTTSPFHEEEVGHDQWRFLQSNPSNDSTQKLWSTPGLIDNYGIKTYSSLITQSSSIFTQLDYQIFKKFHLIGGLRYNYDTKNVEYNRVTYGGLNTSDKNLISLKNKVYTNQSFNTNVQNSNLSFNVTLSYKPNNKYNTYVIYSTAYKPVGVNLGGLPTLFSNDGKEIKDNNGIPVADVSLSVIKPEFVQHTEFGLKTMPFNRTLINFNIYNTDIKDYQTIVQSPQLGVNRGYLSNAEQVNVKGFEVDFNYQFKNIVTISGGVAYIDAKYVKFTNAPLPLEETGMTVKDVNDNDIIDSKGKKVEQTFKDISGGRLPGVSKWNGYLNVELSSPGKLYEKYGRFFINTSTSYRTNYSSNPSPSNVLIVNNYSLTNMSLGFKSSQFSIFMWVRNITNTNYFEQLLPAAGNNGLYGGVIGDPRTYGLTIRHSLSLTK